MPLLFGGNYWSISRSARPCSLLCMSSWAILARISTAAGAPCLLSRHASGPVRCSVLCRATRPYAHHHHCCKARCDPDTHSMLWNDFCWPNARRRFVYISEALGSRVPPRGGASVGIVCGYCQRWCSAGHLVSPSLHLRPCSLGPPTDRSYRPPADPGPRRARLPVLPLPSPCVTPAYMNTHRRRATESYTDSAYRECDARLGLAYVPRDIPTVICAPTSPDRVAIHRPVQYQARDCAPDHNPRTTPSVRSRRRAVRTGRRVD